MTKQTSINQIEIIEGGTIQFRIAKDHVDDGVTDLDLRRWHRSAIPPGGDVDAQMASVNAHLIAMGWPAVSDYQSLKDHAALAATPENIAAYQASLSAQDA